MSTPPTMVKQLGHGWRVFYSKVGLLGGADGVVCDKISPEILKSSTENVVPRGSGESDVKVQVVDADESEAENFLRFDQMSEIGAGEILTRIAAAAAAQTSSALNIKLACAGRLAGHFLLG